MNVILLCSEDGHRRRAAIGRHNCKDVLSSSHNSGMPKWQCVTVDSGRFSMTQAATPTSILHRRQRRQITELPTSIGGNQGITRDISASGLFVVQSKVQEVGSRIDFTVDLDIVGGKLKLCCEGRVIRVEKIDDKIGLGVKILSQTVKSFD